MKKVHKSKLKTWVKVVLVVAFLSVLGMCINCGIKNFNDAAKKCDKEKGYICSYYEIRQNMIAK